MRRCLIIFICLTAVVSCSRPLSYEPFVLREKAEYGDTYSYDLNLSDSTASYSLSFYTRIERRAFNPFETDSLGLDLRWISPSGSVYSETAVLSALAPSDSSYFDKDCIWNFRNRLIVPEYGNWRLRVQVLNNPEELRGLGIIFKEKKDGTR